MEKARKTYSKPVVRRHKPATLVSGSGGHHYYRHTYTVYYYYYH